MTATLEDETQLIDRDELARALRTAAQCWEGPRLPGVSPRQVAAEVTAGSITDQPRRGSEWMGDNEPGLTVEQAQRAIREYVVRAVPPEYFRQAVQDVLDAIEGYLAAPEHGNELAPGDGGALRVHCAACGNPFAPKTRKSRYCKPSCRQKAYKDRQKAQGDGKAS